MIQPLRACGLAEGGDAVAAAGEATAAAADAELESLSRSATVAGPTLEMPVRALDARGAGSCAAAETSGGLDEVPAPAARTLSVFTGTGRMGSVEPMMIRGSGASVEANCNAV